MSCRRRRSHLNPGPSDQTSNIEQLAFKYKEKCKVESSTDSDSEISPRWSDTSTMECVSSAPESGSLRWTLPLLHGKTERQRCYSLFLDPYDGSSEDSDEIIADPGALSRRTRQHGKGGHVSHHSRRFIFHPSPPTGFKSAEASREQEHRLLGVRMKCVDVSEVWMCEQSQEVTGVQAAAADFKVFRRIHDDTTISDNFSERSSGSCNLRVVSKRKLAVPAADGLEQRKKQCVVQMEEEQEGGGHSASIRC
ncbi:uncharacterized protein LOC130931267 [Corythoichthys intestinalis]|uniref:uncharacterized protein LOC130931267 n=1 Tax=Corythoichthys intestinalis TaxID=161448 RepID=UPI0025A5AD5B|nr:uncharacterized protein LOC130931267 [Corythoichthys intestinalis]